MRVLSLSQTVSKPSFLSPWVRSRPLISQWLLAGASWQALGSAQPVHEEGGCLPPGGRPGVPRKADCGWAQRGSEPTVPSLCPLPVMGEGGLGGQGWALDLILPSVV